MFPPTTQHTIEYIYQFNAESEQINRLHIPKLSKPLATVRGGIPTGEWGREA